MHALERPPLHSIARPACRPQARTARLQKNLVCNSNKNYQSARSSRETPLLNPSSDHGDAEPGPSFLRTACRTALAFVVSAAVTLSPGPEPGWGWPYVAPADAAEAYSVAAYERAVAGRHDGGSDGPNLALFTEDAQKAMGRLREYGRYVESVCPAEELCGPACTENREVLERAWQVVASEHYSASGTFSQTGWADALLRELQSRGGLLPTQSDLQSALTSLMASLYDPYTQFLPPSAFRRALRRPLPREQSYLRAQYVGLGLELGPVVPGGGGRVVLAPLAGSPAEAAGISRGDTLISIDGTPVAQLAPEQLAALMRGPAGSTATLEWSPAPSANAAAAIAAAAAAATATTAATADVAASPGAGGAAAAAGGGGGGSIVASSPSSSAGASLVFPPGGRLFPGAMREPSHIVMDVERRDLPQPAIKVSKIPMGPPGFYVTYVRLLYFGSETTEGLEAALRHHEGSPGNLGYVLDLRNNPGGVFEEAIASASLFLKRGSVIAKTIRGPEEVVDTVWQAGALPPDVFPSLPGRLAVKPAVLLANRSTASASEVFVGALRDNGRAPLVGERTFGKGLVQYYFPLREGKDGGLRVTVAKYLTPSGYDISGRKAGLAPDRACTDFPHGGTQPPSSLQQSDECIRQAAALLADRA
ncbi:hypothetical protein PLESTB_001311400 [Pleodorina starrii]|uniref:PDZ domain-containing protein n=1 Tax=Pleodorina starrii TaxID=330485 RepID=A0A9W6BTD1_9CHLO|nr:hypothetical protein PLESTM_000960300 [Pleodorina starrii]GLC58039.1 hypothetical protein PLESTB_001311400 [Pleodorina starrii]GLC70064.1 hypothetical protein PLESTF_000919500 [Pleodorina starrii]